ncbi:hypothetical protein BU25DRAFT_273985 [Macroventuria anomochaeta]|uniref:Uncharacterized protein n=1 Tax=Macroventuria anomochaeta TaxID=301207 RepID=A0ACB6S969_9PLEO|nr:uncharacterized protein BU25DRAFT_273985 [Macroventuria anomochaeta]KAF2629769.1 hypothetical protein BU25DRAFT_273985 [Macroventuria anomochaeta]
MATLLSLPNELLHEVLEYLQPVTQLPHPLTTFDPNEWDIRHWGRALAAVARTCRLLHDLAVPLLYSLYEARFQIPIHAFVDRISSDTSLHKGLKSIITRNEGPYCAKYKPTRERRALYHTWAKARHSQLKQYGIRTRHQLTTDECAQLEVWKLVSQAPNLEVLSVKNSWSGNFVFDLPPVWLLPVAMAASRVFLGLENKGWFEQLHTLIVNMNEKCGVYLALFFHLPRLQCLSISSVQWIPMEDRTPWPESIPTSKVHTLELEAMEVHSNFIVRMIDCCQALISFKCDRAHDEEFAEDDLEGSRAWCTEILDSLQRHSKTLKELVLEPFDRDLRESSDHGFIHLDGLRSLEALESLEVPSMLLMGRPPGTVTNGVWSPTGHWQYPAIRDVMPPKLQTLLLHMRPEYTPGNQGFEDFFIGGLPLKANECNPGTSDGLKTVEMDYMRMPHNGPLPMDFWQIQHAFKEVGSTFQYGVILDIDDNFDQSISLDAETNVLAKELSTYGPKGVQMALHFHAADKTLPRRVMDVLGLKKAWLETKEAKEVLFEEKCDYDAVETKWERLEEARRLRAEAAERYLMDDDSEDTPDDDDDDWH